MPDTKLVGIVNVTPDSFSDDGTYLAPTTAIDALERLIAEEADIIDIGAESTRPGATPLTTDEEWRRLAPVLAALPRFRNIPIQFSLDTRHATTAAKALEHGIHWINDVSGFADPAMVETVRHSSCKLVAMHSLTVPADKSIVLPDNTNVIDVLLAWGKQRISELEASGIARQRIIFDPGIGFGKTARQSWDIINGIGRFHELGVPILVGHSRKSFLGEGNRDDATLNVSDRLMRQGVDYLRVHDVAKHRQWLKEIGA